MILEAWFSKFFWTVGTAIASLSGLIIAQVNPAPGGFFDPNSVATFLSSTGVGGVVVILMWQWNDNRKSQRAHAENMRRIELEMDCQEKFDKIMPWLEFLQRELTRGLPDARIPDVPELSRPRTIPIPPSTR